MKEQSARLFDRAQKFLEDTRIQTNIEEEKTPILEHDLVMLSDENESEEESNAITREKPGNAQFLETPRVQ